MIEDGERIPATTCLRTRGVESVGGCLPLCPIFTVAQGNTTIRRRLHLA